MEDFLKMVGCGIVFVIDIILAVLILGTVFGAIFGVIFSILWLITEFWITILALFLICVILAWLGE